MARKQKRKVSNVWCAKIVLNFPPTELLINHKTQTYYKGSVEESAVEPITSGISIIPNAMSILYCIDGRYQVIGYVQNYFCYLLSLHHTNHIKPDVVPWTDCQMS